VEQFELAPMLAEEICAHAREAYPEEACGIIAGAGSDGIALYRGRNLSPTPCTAFDLDAETLARQLDFEDVGLAMTAIYHSHPAGPETPSQLDVNQASGGYPGSVTIICSLADISNPVLRAFRMRDGLAREIPLVRAPEVLTLTSQSLGNTLLTEERALDVP
jgi:proteasome lid subunit RPN8/RPN11